VLAAAALLTLPVIALAADGLAVQTDAGVVIGSQNEGIAEFLGIPYAAPPVGDLRFSAPQPHAPWSTPLQATQFGSPCPQTNRLNSASTNEDCLFLNVFAPLPDDDQGAGEDEGRLHGSRPVMVFVHGGTLQLWKRWRNTWRPGLYRN
jgi:para-nitrobenzyl esterase